MMPVRNHSNRFQTVFYTFPDFIGWYAQILRAKSNIFLHDRSDNLIVWILKNHARTLSYIPQLVRIFRVTSVYPHRSISWHKKRIYMFCKCGLSRTVMTKNCNKLPFFHIDIHLIDCPGLADNIAIFIPFVIFKYQLVCLYHIHGLFVPPLI